MLEISLELLRMCTYRKFIFLVLFISYFALARCQVVRKSVELPVKDYLASPSAAREARDGRDQLYVVGSNIDAVRSFEVLSKHTPASALMFAGLTKEKSQVGPIISTNLPLISTFGNIQGHRESTDVSGLFAQSTPIPKVDSRDFKFNLPKSTLQTRVSSPSTKSLEEGIEQAKYHYAFPSTISSDQHDTRGSLAFGQEFIPVYTTPVPSFYQNDDAAFGYFNKFPFPLPTESGAISRQNVGFQSFQHFSPPSALKYISPNYKDDTNPYSNTLTDDPPAYKNHKGRDDYYKKSNEYQDYDTSYEREKSPTFNKEKEPTYYERESNEQNSYNNPQLNEGMPHYSETDNYDKGPNGQQHYGPSGRKEEPYKEKPDSYYNEPQGNSETDSYDKEPHRQQQYGPSGREEESSKEPDSYYNEPQGNSETDNYDKEPHRQQQYGPSGREEEPSKEPNSYYNEPQGNSETDNYDKEPHRQQQYGPSGIREEEISKEKPDSYYKEPQGNSETSKSEETQVSKPSQDDNPLPYVPPTKGVIGLKTLKDPNDTPWTPIITKELLDLPEQYIKEDLKKGSYMSEAPIPTTPTYEQYNNEGQNQSDKGEESNKGGDKDESEEEEEDDEEEEGEDDETEEEEEDESESQDDGKNENTNQVPLQPPPQYDGSYNPKPTIQYQETGPSEATYYDEDQTLPPGPPYYPTSYEQDTRNNVGYQPPKTVNLGVTPYESYDGNVKQTWTPIIPSESTQTDENKSTPKYKSENGRWLLNGGPILTKNFAGSEFGDWNDFGKDKSIYKEPNYDSPKHIYKQGRGKKKYHGWQKEEQVESKDLPVEHRYNRESKEDDATRENSEEPEGIDYEPPPPPPDRDEQRVRAHVSDHEFPRKVPTRLRYPGGGLWAKPAPGSNIDLGFVPKKVYTQTRRHNVVRHLPRAAAVAAASTAEELINAPRLREVVSHKKIQEVYEEEGYEDTGYNHGGYKKHGENEADTQKEDSVEYQPQGDGGEAGEEEEEEAFEDHVAQLEAVPEGDPASQGSANKQKVIQTTVQPRVKGQWKQQTTVTNEKSMAFLDEQGKGGILTQKHLPKTLGMTGTYVDVSGEGNPVIKEVRDFPEKLTIQGGAVSTESVFNHPATLKVQGVGILNEGINQKTAKYFFPEYRDQSDHYISNHKAYQDPNNQHVLVLNKSAKSGSESKENAQPSLTHSSHIDELAYSTESTPFYNGNSKTIQFPDHIDYNKGTPRNKSKYSSRYGITRSNSPTSKSVDALDESKEKSVKRERKSRDLTAFGIDQTHVLSQSEFTHPTVALKAIEDQLSQISIDSHETPPRTRQVSQASDTGRKYKEIVRISSQSQDDRPDGRRDKILNVKLKDEVNIRHPFLPRDESGDVQIDYVQTRTRTQPSSFSSRGRKSFREGNVALAPTTEEPTTTTTPKVTTVEATTTTTTTTTEYTPEDPAQVLSRLRVNPFLSSIFPDQEKHEDKISYSVEITSTTPKITTYRAKPTTAEPQTSETPENIRERLKYNPFLTAVFLPKSEVEPNKDEIPSTLTTQKPKISPQIIKPRHKEYTQLQRGSRVRPIVVVPDVPDIETDSSVKHVEQLTLAHYSGPSNGLLYQVPINARQRMNNLARHLNTEGVETMHIVVRRSAGSESKEESINVASAGTTTEIPVDTEKYPFYYSPESVNIFKYSPLRYASNPKDIPIKTAGGMEFYESRDKAVNCEEPTPPKNIVPTRQKDGEWNKDPQPKKQRLGKLGDQIDCLKLKYFGEDPLDNPFFKETLVGVPNLTTQSPDDGFGFYSDIVQNIKSDPESNGKFFEGVNKKRHVNPNENGEHFRNDIHSENNRTSNSYARVKHTDGYKFENPSEKNVEESRIANKYVARTNKSINQQLKGKLNDVESLNKTEEIVKRPAESLELMALNEGVKRPLPPIRLHQPSNVIISLRSKGTSNHPKIRLVKSSYSPYNINIKVMPMSTVGYLKSHTPQHVTNEPSKIPFPLMEQPQSISDPLYILDTFSSEARTITKREKYPTTVTFLTLNPEGRLIHQHIRTFVPVLSQPMRVEQDTNLNTEEIRPPSSEHVLSDDRRGEPKYRVKRNDLNEQYINSQESKELTNFLLRKYADTLAKEKQEHSRGIQNKINRPSGTDSYYHESKIVTENYPAKSTLATENYPPNFNKFISTTPVTFTENYPTESTSETENYPPNFRLLSTTKRPLAENYASDSTSSTENYPPALNQLLSTTTRSLGGFLNRFRPPYSSRYTAEDPMHESPSTEVEAASDSRDGLPTGRNNLQTRKPKVRFPKLTINAKIDKEKTKLLNLADTTLRISTTTTTTTEPPPSTTTRMYKPRVVYKKEYGKPIDKVVNMFAALNRPASSTESTTSEPTTESAPDMFEPPKRPRKQRPRRLQQFERRRITKEETFRTTYSPDEIKERSDKVEIYDSIYDHPDLRGPGTMARRSRDSPAEEYQEILIYMVNPMTGVGEWKLMPVPATTISRMDKHAKDIIEKHPGMKLRQKSRDKSRSSLDKEYSEIERVEEQGGEAGETTIHSVVEGRESTAKPGRPRGKTRRKHGRRRHKVEQHIGTSEEAPTSESSTTLENSTPTSDSDAETTPDETPSSTIHPKVILEPHKRKYFYAKI